MPAKLMPGQVGDMLEVTSPQGGPPQRGRIVQVLGRAHHERYLVRWTDEHESIHYPSDGTRIVHPDDVHADA
jgi:hypothetical protein